jgi:hypothetical protein
VRVLTLGVQGREENLGTGETANQICASRDGMSLAHRPMGVVNVRVWADLNFGPGGHFKIPHPWPGQNPPPDGGGHGMITR